MSTSHDPQTFADGAVYFWIEQSFSIHLKAASPHSDPVELTAEEARLLGLALLEAARELEASNTSHPVA